jgi:putative phosphoribosyl transferase
MSVVARHPRNVVIQAGQVRLEGDLGIPEEPRGIVIFAHGSGSGRFSPRNRRVAEDLRSAGLGTLLLDLLTENESEDRSYVFDIALLAERLAAAARWARGQHDLDGLPIGYFGASTGAGAALVAASRDPAIGAVVSRGGRPDLADGALEHVTCPTLLIVGGEDGPVIDLNEEALARLGGVKDLVIVPGAGHLFEGPGQLEEVSRLAAAWFARYLAGRAPGAGGN